MYLTSLCRTYGAHNSTSTLPTALPWANLPVRLTARGVSRVRGLRGFRLHFERGRKNKPFTAKGAKVAKKNSGLAECSISQNEQNGIAGESMC